MVIKQVLIYSFIGFGGLFGLYFAIESTATYSIVSAESFSTPMVCAASLEHQISLSGGGKIVSVGAGAAASDEGGLVHSCYAVVKHGGF